MATEKAWPTGDDIAWRFKQRILSHSVLFCTICCHTITLWKWRSVDKTVWQTCFCHGLSWNSFKPCLYIKKWLQEFGTPFCCMALWKTSEKENMNYTSPNHFWEMLVMKFCQVMLICRKSWQSYREVVVSLYGFTGSTKILENLSSLKQFTPFQINFTEIFHTHLSNVHSSKTWLLKEGGLYLLLIKKHLKILLEEP